MQEKTGIASRLVKTTLNKISQVFSRLIASAAAILVAGSLALTGMLLLFTGLLIVQQTLSRLVGVPIRLSHMLSFIARIFGALAAVAPSPSRA